jgi:hypothetical protein
MPHRALVRFAVVAVVTLALTGCVATQEAVLAAGEPAGFLHGLWHGFISPVAFVIGLFSDARIYAVPNTGLWYDLGFMLGIGGFSGGILASRKKN